MIQTAGRAQASPGWAALRSSKSTRSRGTPSGPLHGSQVLERAYSDRHVRQLDVDRPGSKLGVGQDALETLDHIQVSELRGDQCSLAASQQRGDGALGAEQRLPHLDVTAKLSRNAGKSVEILRRWVGTTPQSFVPRTTPRRAHCQAADDHETDIRLNEASEELIKKRRTQRGEDSFAQLQQLARSRDRLFEIHSQRPLSIRLQPDAPHTLAVQVLKLLRLRGCVIKTNTTAPLALDRRRQAACTASRSAAGQRRCEVEAADAPNQNGGGEIRTPGTPIRRTTLFESAAFNHSATPPGE